MKPICFGFIGFGQHAQKVAFPAILLAKNCVLGAIASTHKHQDITQAKAYEQYYQLLEDDSIDAVYIASENNHHAELVIRALEHKKHVLCEKPLALNFAEAKKIKSSLELHHRLLREAFMYRLHPIHHHVKELISRGIIGNISRFEGEYSYNLDLTLDCSRNSVEKCGGALNDVGCYLIDSACYLFEALPHAVTGEQKKSPSGVDSTSKFKLFFDREFTAELSCSIESPRKHWYRVIGDAGSIYVPQAFHITRNQKVRVEISRKGKAVEVIECAPYNSYQGEFELFASLISNIETASSELGDGLANACVLGATHHACQENELVKISYC